MSQDLHQLPRPYPEDRLQEQLVSYNVGQILELLKTDLDYMAGVVAPDVYTAPLSVMHHSIWVLLTESLQAKPRLSKHAIGIPRGHAKTHLLKLLIVYITLFTDLTYILVVGNTASLARSIVDDVMGMLASENIIKLFGDYRAAIEKDNAEVRKFTLIGKRMIIKPIGAGTAVRGTNIDNRRPQVIICDDMQSLVEAESPDQSDALFTWFLGTLMKARDYQRCHVLYVGNMYPDVEVTPKGHPNPIYTCILRNLQNDPEWVSWVTGAFLADGSTIWPEVHPPEALLSDLRSDMRMGKGHIWYAEVQNDPRATAGMFWDASKAQPMIPSGMEFVFGRYIMIDPSLGKKTSDGQQVGLFEVFDEAGTYWKEVRKIQKAAPELVMEVITWALETNTNAIFCESYGYQASLVQWFNFWLTQMGIHDAISVYPITRPGSKSNKTKNVWIYESFPSVYNGQLRMHPNVLAAYSTEATNFNPMKEDNTDDILDVGEYGLRIWLNHLDSTIVKREARAGSYNHKPDTDFDVRTYDFRE